MARSSKPMVDAGLGPRTGYISYRSENIRTSRKNVRETSVPMLTHAQIWGAIDCLAGRAGLSASGLARRAGLDATTFNPSKRVTREGHQRWPSTESIAKALAATGTSVDIFASLIGEGLNPGRVIPLVGFTRAGESGFFDEAGFPVGEGWDEIPFPAMSNEQAYALEISGDAMMPAYRDGDRIVVSPAAPVRRGDRVVVRTRAGEIMVKQLKRQTARTVELKSLNPDHPDCILSVGDVRWIARIVWASQ